MNKSVRQVLSIFWAGLLALALVYPWGESEAVPRRKRCNPRLGAERAMEYIQMNERLAKLAGVTYKANAAASETMASLAHNDGEILTDVDVSSLDADGRALKELEESEFEAGDYSFDINVFEDEWLAYMDELEEREDFTAGGIEKKALMKQIKSWFGTRYRYGGTSSRGIDCSAFMLRIYENAAYIRLPRTARAQHTLGMPVADVEDLRFGDLVFFNTRRRVYVSHVGVYLGDNLFAHSSSRYGVTISSLESKYYSARFIGGRRLMVDDIATLSLEKDLDDVSQSHNNVSDTLTLQQ